VPYAPYDVADTIRCIADQLDYWPGRTWRRPSSLLLELCEELYAIADEVNGGRWGIMPMQLSPGVVPVPRLGSFTSRSVSLRGRNLDFHWEEGDDGNRLVCVYVHFDSRSIEKSPMVRYSVQRRCRKEGA